MTPRQLSKTPAETVSDPISGFCSASPRQAQQDSGDVASLQGRRVLLVEDDEQLRCIIVETLRSVGAKVDSCAHGKEAITLLCRSLADFPDVIVSDVQMPEMDGAQLHSEVRKINRYVPFVYMTAFGTVDRAVTAMREGAWHYLCKPFSSQKLVDVLLESLNLRPSESIIAQDGAMQRAIAAAQRLAGSEASVLITGESGCGKEILARHVHQQSSRSKGPFVAVNCAALPESLVESELFGHEKGAFTGAVARRIGFLEQAHGGSIFLDEIAEMPLPIQAKVLRALQEKQVTRLGGSSTINVDIRIISATNRNMKEAVETGVFREDLYYRLAVLPLHLPALRQRPADILPLARHFLSVYGRRAGELEHFELSDSAKARLLAYHWPGNVRELENAVQYAIAMADGLLLDVNAFDCLAEKEVGTLPETASSSLLRESRKREEYQLILEVLKDTSGKRRAAADRLGISERTLRNRLQDMRNSGVDVDGTLRDIA